MAGLPRIGVMYDFRCPPGAELTWSELAQETLAAGAELDDAGVDGLWLTEHHFTDDGYLPALLTMAAVLAVRTRRCHIGTSVLLAPLHHPLAIAEQAAVVDNLSPGRLILGLGLGYRPEELAAFGVGRAERAARLEETIEICRQAWAPGPVELAGRHFQLSGMDVRPKPVREPPIWLAARAGVSAERAGRVAAGAIVAGGPELPGLVRDAAERAGRDRDEVTVACLRTFVAEDCLPADQLEAVGAALQWRTERYQRWYADAVDLPQDRALVSAGTTTRDSAVRTMAEELAELARLAETGIDHVIYHGSAPGLSPSVYLPQWRRLLAEVG